jgi:DNA gyrase subunit A
MMIHPHQHLFIITAKGIMIRIAIDEEIPLQGRDTQGVHLNRLDEDDKVASIACSEVGEELPDDTSDEPLTQGSKEKA